MYGTEEEKPILHVRIRYLVERQTITDSLLVLNR